MFSKNNNDIPKNVKTGLANNVEFKKVDNIP
jgi:hypothetical protein